MSTISKIVVQATKEGEFRKLLHTLNGIKSGFYVKNGFFINTKEIKYPYTQKNVYLPEYLYKQIHQNTINIENIVDIEYLNPIKVPLNDITNIFSKIYTNLKEPKINKSIKVTELESILKYMEDFSKVQIEKVYINYTSCGTGSSYTYANTNNKEGINLYLYPRYDCYDYSLKASLIRAFITVAYKSKTFQEYNSLVDFFINTLKIEDIDLINTKNNKSNISSEVLSNLEKDSNELLASLGILNMANIDLIEDKIVIKEFGELTFLSANEVKLIKLLINNRGSIVTYEQIGNVLWEKEDKYSLSAMSKVVERIRGKLLKNKIFNEVIITHRSKGYSLA